MFHPERLKEQTEVSFKYVLLMPEPEQYTQGLYNVHLICRMGEDERDYMLFGNLLFVMDTLVLKMIKELA